MKIFSSKTLQLILFCQIFLISNLCFSQTSTELTYVCHNANGIDEFLKIKMISSDKITEINYSSTKSKKSLKLTISKQSDNIIEVLFPGDKAVYKITKNGDTMICLNPDGTKQTFVISNEPLIKNNQSVSKKTDTLMINEKIYKIIPSSSTVFNTAKIINLATDKNNPKQSENKFNMTLQNGKTKVFESTGIETPEVNSYSYVKSIKYLNCWLFNIGYYEAGASILVNRNDGSEELIISNPLFSPDSSSFLIFNCDIWRGMMFNGMELWSINNGKIKKMWQKDIQNWGPNDIRWINNSEIVIKECNTEEKENYVRIKIK